MIALSQPPRRHGRAAVQHRVIANNLAEPSAHGLQAQPRRLPGLLLQHKRARRRPRRHGRGVDRHPGRSSRIEAGGDSRRCAAGALLADLTRSTSRFPVAEFRSRCRRQNWPTPGGAFKLIRPLFVDSDGDGEAADPPPAGHGGRSRSRQRRPVDRQLTVQTTATWSDELKTCASPTRRASGGPNPVTRPRTSGTRSRLDTPGQDGLAAHAGLPEGIEL